MGEQGPSWGMNNKRTGTATALAHWRFRGLMCLLFVLVLTGLMQRSWVYLIRLDV